MFYYEPAAFNNQSTDVHLSLIQATVRKTAKAAGEKDFSCSFFPLFFFTTVYMYVKLHESHINTGVFAFFVWYLHNFPINLA